MAGFESVSGLFGQQRQAEIYFAAARGAGAASIPTNPEKLRIAARDALPERAFVYADGSAGSGATAVANRHALDRRKIVPRVLRDIARIDTATELFGRTLASPLIAGPLGALELAHPDADLAVARACAGERVPMVFSNQASVAMEEIAAAMGDAPRWFQLYWSKSDALTESMIRRAEACGCEAIVVTLDTPLLGWRTGDLDLAYLPFQEGRGLAQYLTDPAFRAMLGRAPEEDRAGAVQLFLKVYADPTLTWERLAFVRTITRLPIVLKGILHPQDAEIACAHGVDGIIVSNHGGRQVDGAIGAADALGPVVAAVGGRIPVLFDSGVRGGADVVKALALGARGVLIGRPVFYALAVAGERGVRELLRNMRAELDLTMALAGVTRIADLGLATLSA